MRPTVFVFVKAPMAGAVKTRLGASIGMGRAAALFRIMTIRTIAQATSRQWRTVLAVEKRCEKGGWRRLWPKVLARASQGEGDLGARMARIFAAAPKGPALIVGADAPGLRARHLREAFSALRRVDAVFGPAQDGGYWLMGLARRGPMARCAPDLFKGVRWSSRHALEDTIARLPEGLRIARLETLRDVDEADDLQAFGARSTAW
jgi:hypothetical protein